MEEPATIETTDGACVSYVIDDAELAELVFPAASVNAPLATDTEPEPLCVSAVGVYTTEYDVPEPVNEDNAPPLAVMSPTTKSVVDSDNVNVKVDVWLALSDVEVAAIVTVGAVVSTRCDKLAEIPVNVNVALFDAASRIVPPPAESVLKVALTPLVSLSPATTVYEKTKAVVPVPLT